MVGIARVVLPERPHHVTQRSVESWDEFFWPEDRAESLRLLGGQVEGRRPIHGPQPGRRRPPPPLVEGRPKTQSEEEAGFVSPE